MHTKLLLLFAFVSVGSSHDIIIGSDAEGRKIFDEVRQANPAIWRQIENVTIIAPDDEIISRVVVTDMRPEKDGDAEIVNGGAGQKMVTIELKSPTVLRGYEFHLEVYTVPETMLTDSEEHIPEPTVRTDQPNLLENSDTVSQESDGSGDDVQSSDTTNSADKTTEMPENSTDNIPAQVGRVDGDILRPARGTSNENNEGNAYVHPSQFGSDPEVTTAENIETEMDVNENITTEADITTKLDENEEITPAPESFDNSKNIPDYPSLSILDLIKNKEAARRIRHTDDEINETNDDSATTENIPQSTENVDTYTSLPVGESSSFTPNDSDDTIDLLPPVETEYSSDFSPNNENAEKDLGSFTDLNNTPREGRGFDVDDLPDTSIETSTSTIDITTSDNSEASTTEAALDEQNRNARDAGKDDLDNDRLDSSLDPTQNNDTPLCGAVPTESDKPTNLNANVIILKGDEQITLTPDNNILQFGIPIVLIIGSDSNIPTIKIIAERTDVEPENKDIQPLESSIEDEPVPEEKLNEFPQVDGEEMPDDFVPKPVINLN